MPFTMPWIETVHTLVHSWMGGQEAGHAIADILFGEVCPSGRLSLTFPKRLEDTPAFLTFGKLDRRILYGEGVFVGYRYYEKLACSPLFYFGYGLSYTCFEYSNIELSGSLEASERFAVGISFDITNVGQCAGSEVIQVYIKDPVCSIQRPLKELKAFR